MHREIETLSAYELLDKKNIEELNSTGYLLRHKKTGARVALMENDDENKDLISDFVHRLLTVPVCRILWSIPCCVVPEIFR